MSVWGFLYGGLINPNVMKRVGFHATKQIRAWLHGFDLRISPLVNLVQSEGDIVFGLLLEATHDQLAHVYSNSRQSICRIRFWHTTMNVGLSPRYATSWQTWRRARPLRIM